jgi:hypothetical protein
VPIPALGGEDVAVVQSLLKGAGFFFRVQDGLGECPQVILIRAADVPEVKKFLSEYRIRTPGDAKTPIPW